MAALQDSSSFCCQLSVCCAILPFAFVCTLGFLCHQPNDVELTTALQQHLHDPVTPSLLLDDYLRHFLFRVLYLCMQCIRGFSCIGALYKFTFYLHNYLLTYLLTNIRCQRLIVISLNSQVHLSLTLRNKTAISARFMLSRASNF